jgi:hypothetical protein
MKSEDFSVWLSGISGMSAAQRTDGLAALEKAAADASPGMKMKGKRREDALGTTGVERVERQGSYKQNCARIADGVHLLSSGSGFFGFCGALTTDAKARSNEAGSLSVSCSRAASRMRLARSSSVIGFPFLDGTELSC